MASCSAQACTHVLGTELPAGDHGPSGAHTPHPWPAAGHSPARSALLMVEQWVGLGPPKRPVGEGNKQSSISRITPAASFYPSPWSWTARGWDQCGLQLKGSCRKWKMQQRRFTHVAFKQAMKQPLILLKVPVPCGQPDPPRDAPSIAFCCSLQCCRAATSPHLPAGCGTCPGISQPRSTACCFVQGLVRAGALGQVPTMALCPSTLPKGREKHEGQSSVLWRGAHSAAPGLGAFSKRGCDCEKIELFLTENETEPPAEGVEQKRRSLLENQFP